MNAKVEEISLKPTTHKMENANNSFEVKPQSKMESGATK